MAINKMIIPVLLIMCFSVFGCMFSVSALADDEHSKSDHHETEEHHSHVSVEKDNEGSEEAGQIAAWLLLVANLPVMISIIVRWTNRFLPVGETCKTILADFNRFQKKYLMILHYYLNPAILGVVVWHFMSSKCQSTSLPEWGFLLMAISIVLGFLVKFKLCPSAFRKNVHQIHTQPLIIIVFIIVITAGHLIMD